MIIFCITLKDCMGNFLKIDKKYEYMFYAFFDSNYFLVEKFVGLEQKIEFKMFKRYKIEF